MLSARFATNPFIIGYDALNDPSTVNSIKDASLKKRGVIDKKLLQPLYERIFEKISANDSDAIMWFEPAAVPNTSSNFNKGNIYPTGFDEPPGGKVGSANHVLGYHAYCC